MRRLPVVAPALVASVLVASTPAMATPVKTIVLQSEGRVDAHTRAKVDAALVKLASADNAQVTPGEATFSDTATAVGCSPEVPACRDEVLSMLAVDEIVYATLASKPGGVEVTVHRVSHGSTRSAKTLVATNTSSVDLGGVASLFTRKPAPRTTRAPAPTPPSSTRASTRASAQEPSRGTAVEPAPSTDPGPLPSASEPTASVVTTEALTVSTQPIDAGPSRNTTRLQLAGIGAGGAMVLVGFLLWGEAGTIQEEIDVHPTITRPQLEALAELERRGDRYARWGNVFFLGGAILGGVSTYYYVKGRKARSTAQTARLAPAVLGDGAGFTLTFGGTR